ncbi:MAG: LysM peptidoglycan-binding domain-containing protein [Deltaproteobacteria bacterium]|nr:LysM peptidoglycan-binding domain-containing protein [Deltaproteobacteria bacterium]
MDDNRCNLQRTRLSDNPIRMEKLTIFLLRASMMFLLLCAVVLSGTRPLNAAEDTVNLSLEKRGQSRKDKTAYIVQEGDWLYKVVREKYGGSSVSHTANIVEAIQRLNPSLKNMNRIYPGQKLLLPLIERASAPAENKEKISTPSKGNAREPGQIERNDVIAYVIKPGESISGVLHRDFGISFSDIDLYLKKVEKLNPGLADLNRLRPGDVIGLPLDFSKATSRQETPQESPAEQSAVKGDTAYAIRPGDNISRLLIKKFGLPAGRVQTVLETIRRMNPHIRDLNIVRPGQIIHLPRFGEESEPVKEEETGPVRQEEKMEHQSPLQATPPGAEDMRRLLSAFRQITVKLQGTFINEGAYYIPLPSLGQFMVDCSSVPAAEFPEASTVFIDYKGLVPDQVKRLVETAWPSHRIISGPNSTDLRLLVGKLLSHVKTVMDRKVKTETLVGGGSRYKLELPIDRVVTQGTTKGVQEPPTLWIAFLENEEDSFSENIHDILLDNGVELLEIGRYFLSAGGKGHNGKVLSFAHLNILEMAESICKELGYSSERDMEIFPFKADRDGFSLSLKANLAVSTTKGVVAIIRSEENLSPDRFLSEGNTAVITIGAETKRKDFLERLFDALGLVAENGTFNLVFKTEGGNRQGELHLPALKVSSSQGDLFMLDYDAPDAIGGLVNYYWGGMVILY